VANALAACDTDRSQNGKDNHDSGTGVRRQAPLARECTYPDFMKCKPLYFKGTEGVIKLNQWFERMEIVTLVMIVAHAMTWTNLKKKMTDKKMALMCARMFTEVSDKIEKYCVMDKKIRTFAERPSENKREQDDNQQQQQNKRQNTGRAYAAGSGEKKPYGGSKPSVLKMQLSP
ncbi:hypothetical protein Tco_1461836, partial [Tanacetum coccineum]